MIVTGGAAVNNKCFSERRFPSIETFAFTGWYEKGFDYDHS